MKILFSNPPWWEIPKDAGPIRMGIRAGSRWPFTRNAAHYPDTFQFGGYLPFPFFLAHAASYTAKLIPEAQVTMRDSIARGESYGAYAYHLRTHRPDWIVMETATPSWDHDKRMIAALSKDAPACRVILTGTVDCSKADVIMAEYPNVAAIVQGEYDKQIHAVIVGGKRGLIPHNLLTKAEMDAAPFPMFDEACAINYWDACPNGQRPPQLQVWSSRGCPFRCIFCVWPAVMTGNDPDGTKPRSVRCSSPEWFEAMLLNRLAIAKTNGTPYQSIYIDDDTFNLTEKHTIAICTVMKRIGLPWSAMCRADTISNEAWQAMKDSGCFGVKLGFESGSQEVIDKIINKRLNLEEAAKTAQFIQSIGMTVHGTFTIGLPGETKEQQEQTVAFIAKLYADKAISTHQLSGTAEIEGTPLHTLRTAKTLVKYSGAVMDDGYVISPDGQKKVESLIRPALTSST